MDSVSAGWRHGRVRCADSVHTRLFDDELIILDLVRGEYFALDPVGARLWSGLENGRTLDEIAQEITDEYDVTLDRLIPDLVTLGDLLLRQGLLVDVDAGGPRG